MQFLQLLTTISLAAEPAHFSPVQITNESSLFAQSAEYSAPKMQKLQTNMRRLNKDLISLSLNAELLGLTNSDHWSQQQRATIKRFFLQSNHFLNTIQADYNTVYTASMERALEPMNAQYTLSECSISRVDQMAGKTKQCAGKNLTSQIVTAMDSDELLKKDLADIEERPWPKFNQEKTTKDIVPITGSVYGISPSFVAKAIMPEQLQIIQEQFEDNVAPLESAIDDGDEAAIEKAQAFRTQYEKEVEELGNKLTSATTLALTKAGKKDDRWLKVGYCVQPDGFGGCDSEDLSNEVIDLIKNNKKALKELR